eukprot:NODE_761_length_4440_cov_0.463257.p3 type:complete len:111 gc:universal NODE_761_length_4440_cov_0.463257:1713-1381(-)
MIAFLSIILALISLTSFDISSSVSIFALSNFDFLLLSLDISSLILVKPRTFPWISILSISSSLKLYLSRDSCNFSSKPFFRFVSSDSSFFLDTNSDLNNFEVPVLFCCCN